MTKRQAENYARLRSVAIDTLGLASHDFEHLLRIEKALHRWGERECNGEVETDDDGKAWRTNAGYTTGKVLRWKTANRKAGALKRLAAIMARYPKLRSAWLSVTESVPVLARVPVSSPGGREAYAARGGGTY